MDKIDIVMKNLEYVEKMIPALSTVNRRNICNILLNSDKELSMKEIQGKIGMSYGNLLKNIKILIEAKLIVKRKDTMVSHQPIFLSPSQDLIGFSKEEQDG